MIDPHTLQEDLIKYLQAAAPLPGLNWIGSDNTAGLKLPMAVVHIADVKEEWEDSGVYRCFVTLQLHTQGDDENGAVAAGRLKPMRKAMENEDALAAALEPHFTMSMMEFKGAPLTHKDSQVIQATRYEMLLTENIEVPE